MSVEPIEGMTVNERLTHFGLIDAFDDAVRARDLAAVMDVLIQAEFSETQARETATAVLARPGRYGYG